MSDCITIRSDNYKHNNVIASRLESFNKTCLQRKWVLLQKPNKLKWNKMRSPYLLKNAFDLLVIKTFVKESKAQIKQNEQIIISTKQKSPEDFCFMKSFAILVNWIFMSQKDVLIWTSLHGILLHSGKGWKRDQEKERFDPSSIFNFYSYYYKYSNWVQHPSLV